MKGNDMAKGEIEYEILEEYGIIGRKPNGDVVKLTLTRWDRNPPKYDIRPWSESGRLRKGITMTREELQNLFLLMPAILEEE